MKEKTCQERLTIQKQTQKLYQISMKQALEHSQGMHKTIGTHSKV